MNNVSFKLSVPENKNRFNVLFFTIGNSCVLPILQDIRIVQDSKSLQVMATDLENAVSFVMDSQGDSFDFCINAKKLFPFFTDSIEDVFSIDACVLLMPLMINS